MENIVSHFSSLLFSPTVNLVCSAYVSKKTRIAQGIQNECFINASSYVNVYCCVAFGMFINFDVRNELQTKNRKP